MNHLNITQRKISKLHILLSVILLTFLAVPALAQVGDNTKDEPSVSDDSQAQFKRKTQLAINLDRLQFEGTKESQSSPKTATDYLFTKTKPREATPQADPDLSNFAVWINAGAAIPHSDLSFFLDPGFSVNGGLEYMITPQFSAEGTFGYHQFSAFFGDTARLYQVSGNAKFYLVDEESSVRPFVNGGVGAYITDSATTHFGGNFGGGVLFEVTPHFGVQGAYNFHVFSFGDSARFSTVQGGVRFRF